ncbi:MAG: hypothetical protein LBE61_03870 [Burkholderiaceae bacterium]|jgi:hypothetical protein|nr:hypothetical protein [Burkholderiaceae bacterium]
MNIEMISKNDSIQKIQKQIEKISSSSIQRRGSAEFDRWYRNTEIAIENIFGKNTRHSKDFTAISYHLGFFTSDTPDSSFDAAHRRGLKEAEQILHSMIDEIQEYWSDSEQELSASFDAISSIEKICNRFHLVARQLRKRHDDRPTLDVNDEYDVQDLLHALLHLDFDDIRPEEWTPSNAGSSSRVDFLLKSESIVVEVKKTRNKLGARELGNELLIDIGRYQAHPGCKTLICFVYDPDGRIANPRGLEADLNKKVNDLDVKVFIRPTGK